tara:strand:- start:26257 stop:26898 length:642 start_codon:yes stop_codon:yes gene_type:complete
LRERPDVQEQPISPFSTIEVVQRIVPLNVEIEEFGHGIIEGDKKFEIEKIFIGDGEYIPEGESVLKEWFAPGNYFTMGDNEKIKAPSFEKMDAGLRLSREGVDFGNGIDLDQQYEEISLDMSLNHRRKYSSIKSQLKPDTLHKFTIVEGDGIIRGVNPYEMNDRNFTDLDVSVGEASVAGGPQVATFAEAQLMVKRKNQISFDEFKRFEVVSH